MSCIWLWLGLTLEWPRRAGLVEEVGHGAKGRAQIASGALLLLEQPDMIPPLTTFVRAEVCTLALLCVDRPTAFRFGSPEHPGRDTCHRTPNGRLLRAALTFAVQDITLCHLFADIANLLMSGLSCST